MFWEDGNSVRTGFSVSLNCLIKNTAHTQASSMCLREGVAGSNEVGQF